MEIENEFTVAVPADQLWRHLVDVERIAPCMPGAELTETVDDRTWKGRMRVRFGPVELPFAGSVTMDERDDDAHRVVLRARGREARGKGAAEATVTSWLEPAAEGTTVKMRADVTLSGFVAQVSRGLLPDISSKLTRQFAECLEADMAARTETAPAATAKAAGHVQTAPVGGIRLGLTALWTTLVRAITRLFGRSRQR